MSALSILAEECELLNDSKYRSYITQIEKALKSFDNTSEWADLISALGKLNKVLLAHVKYPVIPKRVTIGKRLAQCLHPALPSGVHMKALETYDIIFKCIGTDRLAQDLFIYSAGLFPLLGHAAMNVKTILLMIYERHFVTLGKRIKPGLNGLLLGLLPGLEEGSEFYDQTDALLMDFCECTEPSYFYTCLWECVHSCPSVRLPASSFLLAHYNRKQSMEDQLHMVGLNITLMVEALCCGVQDASVLVQRSMLDFLLVAFPLHNSQLIHSDMAKVVKAAINVLLRRDMSLNRRFYAWLLGTSTTMSAGHEVKSKAENSDLNDSSVELRYFEKYSQDLLVQALRHTLTESPDITDGSSVKSAVLKPFRILISLLDKPEIGPVILESVLLSIFRCLHREFQQSKSEKSVRSGKFSQKGDTSAYDELLKTANLLFGTFEPYFIWDYASRIFEHACEGRGKGKHGASRQGSVIEGQETATVEDLCELLVFLLDSVSLETFSETQTEHLPNLLHNIILSLDHHCGRLADHDIITTLQLCTKMLSKVQPTMTTSWSHDDPCHQSCDLGVEVEVNYLGRSDIPSADSKPLDIEEAEQLNKHLKLVAGKVEPKPANNKPDTTKIAGTEKPKSANNKPDTRKIDTKDDIPDSETERKPMKALTRTHSKHNKSVNLMQQCINSFQEFFHTLVSLKLIKDKDLPTKLFKGVVKDVIDSSPAYKTGIDGEQCSVPPEKVLFVPYDEEILETFSAACQLFVEFASFPMYGQDPCSRDSSSDKNPMPQWVQDLVVCSLNVDNFQVQSAAISTMLDLVILTQSVQTDLKTSSDVDSREGVMSIQILPTLHFQHLRFLVESTHFFSRSAEVLWGYLGAKTPVCHQTTVKLFHILHQVAPSTWVCEDVIGNQLSHTDETVQIEAFKRFTTLWHLTRTRKTDVIPGKPHRTFTRSMFVLLDALKDETSPLKVLATTWLSHVLQQGDISRVMEPLLQMLLHPDTARVSVQHVNIHQPRKVHLSESNDDTSEANIYAISSEGGNVIYHVSTPKTIAKKSSTDELKSYALTFLCEKGTHTAPSRSRSEQELHFDKVDPSNLSLKINPFGSESSIDNLMLDFLPAASSKEGEISRAKRLDKETCSREGISFNVQDESSKDVSEDEQGRDSSVTSSVENIAKDIVDSIIKTVVHPDENENTISNVNTILKEDVKQENTRDKCKTDAVNEVKKSESESRIGSPRKVIQRTESVTSSNAGDHELLNRVQKQRVDSPTPSEKDTPMYQELERDTTNIHTLHMHILLYTQKYDYERTLYALSTLKAMLAACPRMLVTSLVTTNISSLKAPQLAKLQLLLARHRKSVFGKSFFGEIPSETMSTYRSSMFIEVLISVCLYFVRGYYPNLMMSKLSCDELLGNKQVHILAAETLTLMMSEVASIMKDSGKNFVSYIGDLFQRCKVQKALLHCVLAVIYNARKRKDSEAGFKFTEAVVTFNEDQLQPAVNEAFLVKLLDLLVVMVTVEEQIGKYQSVSESTPASEWDRLKVSYQPSLNNVRYTLGHPIVQQGMFVSGLLSALKQTHMCHLHRHWVGLVTATLPRMGRYLPGIVMTVVAQLCRNIEALAVHYETDGKGSTSLENIPPDHILTMLEGLMSLCHYCLLDNVSPVSIGQQTPSSANNNAANAAGTNILSNLFHVFNPVNSRETSPQREIGVVSPVMDARNNILSVMPRIMACLTALWRAVNIVDKHDEWSTLTLGAPKVVRQYILEFISPISLPHGAHLLGAIAVAWNDRRKKAHGKPSKKFGCDASEDQLLLVDLVAAIKVLPMDTLINTVRDVLSNPPHSELNRKKNSPLEVNMLQFFYAYVERTLPGQLSDSWPALCTLLKDALQLNLKAQGQFLLLLIFNEFVQKTPAMVEKRNQREVQELAQRLLEGVANIAGLSLEQTTWLRKNYAVKPGPQVAEEGEVEEASFTEDDSVLTQKRVPDLDPTKANSADSKYSVQALTNLAEITAPLLDVIYSSEEKDKVAPFLISLLYNIFPYLKAHSTNNLPSIRAASQFVSSISSYQYTKKAWRREVFELLLDPSFFQMDMESVGYWTAIVDNLMTHDKTTYKDLMARVSMAQTGSLSLFTSREAEIDLKASMLKRLAFTVLCSEPDQYQKSIPEIQEKLAESLRILQAPSVMAQVFTCFRVLMLRVSPQHLTSMWPTIITELIHVFLQIEQELSTETEEFILMCDSFDNEAQVQRIAALDSSWAHLGNGLNAHNNPSWLQLYLSACKLLDLCLALPADKVPQFQLYRWAFIGGAAAGEGNEEIEEEDSVDSRGRRKEQPRRRKQARFNPHIIRLARLLNTKLQGDVPMMKMVPGRPLLTITHLRSLQELQPFFNTLCLANQSDNIVLAARQLGARLVRNQTGGLTNGHADTNVGHSGVNQSESRVKPSGPMGKGLPKSKSVPAFPLNQLSPDSVTGSDVKSTKQYIEELLLRDFLEPMT
ncbi:protein dopey-1-like isoform X3 [Mya arenaria]|uniref:protein dopey-1-like isoform X3 n=1 Tax=Mya arenaria TaxID=6604 RepID=UPI0022E35088|nr:protein dopey-1-like isoform X3 [Mya arenaria]